MKHTSTLNNPHVIQNATCGDYKMKKSLLLYSSSSQIIITHDSNGIVTGIVWESNRREKIVFMK